MCACVVLEMDAKALSMLSVACTSELGHLPHADLWSNKYLACFVSDTC